MEIKKLNEEQVARLFEFTKQHFVEYYDLQCELADHLANGIEAEWEENPNISFEEALKKEFKKFGIFGFMGLVEQRELALQKKYRKIAWSYAREYLGLPKIMLSIAIVLGTYKLLEMEQAVYSIILLAIILFNIVKLIFMHRSYRRRVKQTGKKWMLENLIYRGGGIGVLSAAPYQISSVAFGHELPLWGMWIMAVWFTAFVFYQYIILIVIPSKAKEHLAATYPEYKMQVSG